MAKINYANKVALNENQSVADINKVTDDDMNEIKTSVNTIYDALGTGTDTYSTSTSYVVGDMVIYNGMIYECTNATSGAWNSANWSLVPVFVDEKINRELLPQIIESGTDYIKYYDGTMICYGAVSLQANENRSSGGLTYYSGATDIDFSQSFTNTDFSMFTTVGLANMNYFCQSYASPNSVSQIRVSFTSTGKDDTRRVSYVAIGKWK